MVNMITLKINIMMELVLFILMILYIGLLGELIFGWSTKPKKKFYRKLFDAKVYNKTLLVSALLLVKPILDLFLIGKFTYPILAIPFIYLLFFKVINWMSLKINQRNIIIVWKGDIWPREHKWYVDSLLHFAATIISILMPLLLNLYLEGRLH